jgi:hypothetical protein
MTTQASESVLVLGARGVLGIFTANEALRAIPRLVREPGS